MDKNGIPHNPAGQLHMIIYADLPSRANGGGGNLGISHRYEPHFYTTQLLMDHINDY